MLGIGGSGAVHAHLLQSKDYRDAVKEELKAQDMGSSLLFNQPNKLQRRR